MITASIGMPADFKVDIMSTENRGLTPEEISKMCMRKIMSVSDSAPPEIREQADAFRQQVEAVVLHYLKQAVSSDRTTVYNALTKAGHGDVAEIIRRL